MLAGPMISKEERVSPELERLVGRAMLDPMFRKQLLDDPDGAIVSGGFKLTPAELDQVREAVKERGQRRDTLDQQLDEAARGSRW